MQNQYYRNYADSNPEYLSAFNPEYFSALDAPIAQNKEMVLESILSMAGLDDIYKKTHDKLVDEEVLTFLTTDINHPFSIISNISFGR